MTTHYSDPIVASKSSTCSYTSTLFRPTFAERELATVRAADPELAGQVQRLVTNVPSLASRAYRAARLVLQGAVTLTETGAPILGWVRSQTGDHDYCLTRGELGVIICNCPDGSPVEGEPGAPASRLSAHTCKHILAAAFLADK